MPLMNLLVTIIPLLLGVATFVNDFIFLHSGNNIVTSFNGLIKLETELNSSKLLIN